jgi:hypothetical protein
MAPIHRQPDGFLDGDRTTTANGAILVWPESGQALERRGVSNAPDGFLGFATLAFWR